MTEMDRLADEGDKQIAAMRRAAQTGDIDAYDTALQRVIGIVAEMTKVSRDYWRRTMVCAALLAIALVIVAWRIGGGS